MKVTHDYLLVGGGSGGHLTPLIPVAEAIKHRNPSASIAHIGQKGDSLNSLLRNIPVIDANYEVPAGKFRRYHGESWVRRLFDVKTNLLNIRDGFRFIAGIFVSWRLLGRLQPKIIFMKGGYVCAPVGIAAGWRKIPYVTHDSDAMVSLAHRVIAKNAALHTTALPPSYYSAYEADKTVAVGIPLRSEFQLVDAQAQSRAKQQLGFRSEDSVLLVVGGGLGARNINVAVVNVARDLLSKNTGLQIVHITGHKLHQETMQAYELTLGQTDVKSRVHCKPFSDQLHLLSAAADLVVTRAGATNMAEFAAQAKACIVIPNPLLTGGHQLKNATAYEDTNSAVILEEQNLDKELADTINSLLSDREAREKLGEQLHKLAVQGSADKIAQLLDEILRGSNLVPSESESIKR